MGTYLEPRGRVLNRTVVDMSNFEVVRCERKLESIERRRYYRRVEQPMVWDWSISEGARRALWHPITMLLAGLAGYLIMGAPKQIQPPVIMVPSIHTDTVVVQKTITRVDTVMIRK